MISTEKNRDILIIGKIKSPVIRSRENEKGGEKMKKIIVLVLAIAFACTGVFAADTKAAKTTDTKSAAVENTTDSTSETAKPVKKTTKKHVKKAKKAKKAAVTAAASPVAK
jgi:uncharacterized protein HemX